MIDKGGNRRPASIGAALCAFLVASVADSASVPVIRHVPFGATPAGEAVELYTLINRRGMQVRIMTYGGIITSLTARDRAGRYEDVVLGFDRFQPYLDGSPYFGALIGRYGNRIASGTFTLDGTVYHLATNDGSNTLHGGQRGFDKVIWAVTEARITAAGPELTLTYLSRDGQEGYPGNLSVSARYTLLDDDSVRLEYRATTDRASVINLTQHSYFNLRGNPQRGDVLGHIVTLNADHFTPVDSTLIPTGELASVAGTPFDFRTPTAIGDRIDGPDQQLLYGKGYDHNWVMRGVPGTLREDARVYEPQSGRVLVVLSDQPGLQFYTGNMLDGRLVGKAGWRYARRSAFCMEPQHFPDSPNHPEFPSTVLRPGETYRSTIIYRFEIR